MTTTIFIVSGTSYTIPSDMSSTQVETIGGGAGTNDSTGSSAFGGAGGGAYSKTNTVSVTPSGSVTTQVGAGGSRGNPGSGGGDTWFNGANLAASSCGAKGGSTTTSATGGAGGTTGGICDTKIAGDAGGNSGAVR